MFRRFLAAIGRALDAVFAIAMTSIKSLIEVMYPGIYDVPPPPVQEIEQALDWDPFEIARERQADREEALADTLTYAAETLTAGQPAEMPASLRPFASWLRGLNERELERLLTADQTNVYAHMRLGMPMPGMPCLDEIRPAPHRGAPAAELRAVMINEPRGLPATAF
ncbi:MAG: hypothetical protein CFE29_03810 [Bradyrhizobiaceae bacterium PARB1]|jgi:hypothetical protein|nr:MAG: hypothetical protein CFE29_03810 [Bradyrhizobiaceae bacterium PARB1]